MSLEQQLPQVFDRVRRPPDWPDNVIIVRSEIDDPLRDPLHVDAGLNRWQRNDHEEAYSDWLAWILEQLDTREVLKSFRRRFDYT